MLLFQQLDKLKVIVLMVLWARRGDVELGLEEEGQGFHRRLDPALEARARDLSKGLRCLVCQNENIDDSDAQLAKDLRVLLRERISETIVRFKPLSKAEIDTYIAGGEWHGKAGGYAIQGIAGSFVSEITGSYSAIVGLPLYETVHLLEGAGYPVFHSWMTAPKSEV